MSTAAAANYSRLVDWLVEYGITTEKQWLEKDKEGYRSFHANSNSNRQIKAALENARAEILLTKCAFDYLCAHRAPACIVGNKVFCLFALNQYDPRIAGTILVKWSQGKWGKRNTIWLTGPASTGKTNLAEAIAHCCPMYGNVNWTNENFPFNDCTDKMIIWWEEGKMSAKIVEAAKAICGGSKVRVDQKCKQSVQVQPTPVIITSNLDMTLVIDGNSITHDHKEPLEHRMWKFTFQEVLVPDWGKISKEDVQEFFAWARVNMQDVRPVFEVPKNPKDTSVTIIDLTDAEMAEAASFVDGAPPAEEPVESSSPIPSCITTQAVISAQPLDPEEGTSGQTTVIVTPGEEPVNKKGRYDNRWEPAPSDLVCLEHGEAHCEECGEDACLFTQAPDLECHERMSDMSGLSDIEPLPETPPNSPVSEGGDRSPPPSLFELFDDTIVTRWRFHPDS